MFILCIFQVLQGSSINKLLELVVILTGSVWNANLCLCMNSSVKFLSLSHQLIAHISLHPSLHLPLLTPLLCCPPPTLSLCHPPPTPSLHHPTILPCHLWTHLTLILMTIHCHPSMCQIIKVKIPLMKVYQLAQQLRVQLHWNTTSFLQPPTMESRSWLTGKATPTQ